MPTFSVFAYGTDESHAKTINIISQFTNACTSDHIYINGPDVLGRKVKPNTEYGVQNIKDWLLKQPANDDPIHINLAGFSRGAVTCIIIANELKKLENQLALRERHFRDKFSANDKLLLNNLKRAKLHIYAQDPVAGLTDKGNLAGRLIPSNVESYVAVLQTDEMRRDFKPQDMTRLILASPANSKVTMLPLYGNHTDANKIKDTEHMVSAPQITWHLMHQFLSQHGTTFSNDKIPDMVVGASTPGDKAPRPVAKNPTPVDLLAIFAKHHEERKNYRESGEKVKFDDGLPIPRTERTLNRHLRFYVKNPGIFVNRLERELFKIAYPRAFNYLFEHNLTDPRFPSHSSKQDVIEELHRLKQDSPELFARLRIKEQGEQILLGAPRGGYELESCTTIQQLYPHMFNPHPDSNIEVEKLNTLRNLEDRIYRMCFRYQREKSEFYFNRERSKSRMVTELRNEVFDIMKKNLSTDDKITSLLDAVEKRYVDLVKATNSSELVHYFSSFLKSNGRESGINTHIGKILLAGLVDGLFSLLKEVARFVAHFGYLGGAILGGIGIALESIGKRCNTIIGDPGLNPLKMLGTALATTLEVVGIVMKNNFGIKPLFEAIAAGIADVRDAIIRFINPINVEPIKTEASEEEAVDHIAQSRNFRAQMQEIKKEENVTEQLDEAKNPTIDKVSTMS